MAYTGNPAGVPRDAVRLEVGDTTIPEILDDASYDYFLSQTSGSIQAAGLKAAYAITFHLSRLVHERTDMLEIYGSEAAKNYIAALRQYINTGGSSGGVPGLSAVSSPYAGGISKQDIQDNIANLDNYTVNIERSRSSESDKLFDAYQEANPFSRFAYRQNPFG